MDTNVAICPKCGAPVPAGASEGLCTRCLLAVAATPTEGGTEIGGEPGRVVVTAPVDRVAAAFPHLEVIDLIGAGGMGAVYKARQPKLDRWVALKILPEGRGGKPAFAERFLREARLLARLSHPHIVAVHDFGQAGGFFYLLMEYVDGVNLRQAMRAGRFSPAQALVLVPQICEALQFAHDHGVMHRDIKPENILLDARGRVKLADFGIAKLLGDSGPEPGLTVTGAAVGTPQYMAPEQIERPGDVDHRADIYSLGVVFYELLTGELPLGRFAPPSSKTPLDTRVDEIVLRALAKERELRQQSADEVRTAVERVGTPAPPSGLPGGGSDAEDVHHEDEAPLWQASPRFRLLTLAVLALFSAGMVYELPYRVRHTLFDPIRAAWQGPDFVLAIVLLLAAGVLAWAAERLLRGEGAWIGPLRSPGRRPPGAGESDLVNRGIRLALRLVLACFAVAVSVLWTTTAVSLLHLLRAPWPHGLPMAVFTLLPLAAMMMAWHRGWREHRRPPSGSPGEMPVWTRTVALGFAVYGLTGMLSLAMVRAGEVVVYETMGELTLPTLLALWFRSRFWRGVALVTNTYATALGLLGVLGLVWIHFRGGGVEPDAAGSAWTGPFPWSYALIAGVESVLIFGLGLWALSTTSVRHAFGIGPAGSTRAGSERLALPGAAGSQP
jgi:tRNA A-37 threonylcarbamoyl transferase component Bud32